MVLYNPETLGFHSVPLKKEGRNLTEAYISSNKNLPCIWDTRTLCSPCRRITSINLLSSQNIYSTNLVLDPINVTVLNCFGYCIRDIRKISQYHSTPTGLGSSEWNDLQTLLWMVFSRFIFYCHTYIFPWKNIALLSVKN